jgi:hypothetical protein
LQERVRKELGSPGSIAPEPSLSRSAAAAAAAAVVVVVLGSFLVMVERLQERRTLC